MPLGGKFQDAKVDQPSLSPIYSAKPIQFLRLTYFAPQVRSFVQPGASVVVWSY